MVTTRLAGESCWCRKELEGRPAKKKRRKKKFRREVSGGVRLFHKNRRGKPNKRGKRKGEGRGRKGNEENHRRGQNHLGEESRRKKEASRQISLSISRNNTCKEARKRKVLVESCEREKRNECMKKGGNKR